jgi:hypothetical protein
MTREDLTEQYPAVGTVHPESPVFRALLVCVGYLGLCERFRRPSVPEVMSRCPGADIVEVARAEFVCASTMDTLHTAFRFRRGSLMKRDFWASWQASTPDRHRIRAHAAPCRAAHWHVASHHQEEERRSDHSRNTSPTLISPSTCAAPYGTRQHQGLLPKMPQTSKPPCWRASCWLGLPRTGHRLSTSQEAGTACGPGSMSGPFGRSCLEFVPKHAAPPQDAGVTALASSWGSRPDEPFAGLSKCFEGEGQQEVSSAGLRGRVLWARTGAGCMWGMACRRHERRSCAGVF